VTDLINLKNEIEFNANAIVSKTNPEFLLYLVIDLAKRKMLEIFFNDLTTKQQIKTVEEFINEYNSTK